MVPLLFMLVLVSFAVAAVVIFRYLRASFRLLELLQALQPELWRSLGSPRRVYVQQQRGGIYTIQPLFPWLSWVWSGSQQNLEARLAVQLLKTRWLLRAGIVSFLVALVAILVLILTAPPPAQ